MRAAVAVLAVTLLAGCTGDDGSAAPRPTPSTAETSSEVPSIDAIVITRPDWPALDVDDVEPPTRDAVPLSEDPVRRASLAVTDLEGDRSIYVLGPDREWRRVDRPHLTYSVEGGASGTFPALAPNSLDAGGSRLAIGQDGSLVVVDLTTGGFRRYRLPGLNQHVAWEDQSHVLVIGSRRVHGSVVDLSTGRTASSRHRRTTRVLPDGMALTWGGRAGNDRYLVNDIEWSDGWRTTSPGNNSLGATPLVRGDVAIGMHNPTHNQLNPDLLTGDAELDELMRQVDGVVAVDDVNGDVLGFLELSTEGYESTSLLGWLGGSPVLGLVDRSEPGRRSYVVSWNYKTGELTPLATLPTWYVAWGAGLA